MVVLIGVVLVTTGVVRLSTGRPAYRNYKGQWVFAGVAIAVGLGALAIAFIPERPKTRRKRARS